MEHPSDTCITVRDIAAACGAEIIGDAAAAVRAVESVDRAGPGQITFARDARRLTEWAASECTSIIASRSAYPAGMHDLAAKLAPLGRALLLVDDADRALVKVLPLFARPSKPPTPGVHPSASVDLGAEVSPSASIGPNCTIAAGAKIASGAVLLGNVYVGRGATIGDHTVLHPGVAVLDHCVVGARCILHANVSIGADGFGYTPSADGKSLLKLPHIGNVVIEDHVEIGANSSVDRAKFGSTLIGAGTKIDNLVQVGHGCRIGRCCILCGHIGLAGSVTIGDGAMLGGKVGVATTSASARAHASAPTPAWSAMSLPAQPTWAFPRAPLPTGAAPTPRSPSSAGSCPCSARTSAPSRRSNRPPCTPRRTVHARAADALGPRHRSLHAGRGRRPLPSFRRSRHLLPHRRCLVPRRRCPRRAVRQRSQHHAPRRRACIRTVEHALSALAGLSVWSCTIEVEGPEIPILDGSSLAFIEAIHAAGLSPLAHPIAPLAPAREHLIHDGKGGSLRILPARSPRFEYLLAYPEGSGIPPQSAAWDGDPATYAASVAPARTFSTKAQAEAARAAGMFTRFSPRDLLVIDTDARPSTTPCASPMSPPVTNCSTLSATSRSWAARSAPMSSPTEPATRPPANSAACSSPEPRRISGIWPGSWSPVKRFCPRGRSNGTPDPRHGFAAWCGLWNRVQPRCRGRGLPI